MSFDSIPPIPPRRTDGVDLSHIRLRPNGTRYAVMSELRKKPRAKAQLEKIHKKIVESRQKQNANTDGS